MALADRWLLPDGMNELLPPLAGEVERVRRRVLDLYDSWGYEFVMPPVAEHLESLLTGVGGDLGLQTFKVTDEITGHMLGIRADITPQIARIDAHRLRTDGVSRLCYCGSVLHTRPAHMLASRNPMQLGAEIFGHAGVDSDAEVISLMLETLMSVGIDGSINLDLGHVAVFSELVKAAGLNDNQIDQYIDILQRKALPELDSFVNSLDTDADYAEQLRALACLNGSYSVLERARRLFANNAAILAAVSHLEKLSQILGERFPGIGFYFDLGELRGYRYHTGIVFAVYSPKYSQSLAKGGRYDQIGADFGRARALNEHPKSRAAIIAPAANDQDLIRKISELRTLGERVVNQLEGASVPECCDRQLVKRDSEWVVIAL